MNYTIFKPNPNSNGGLVNLKVAKTKSTKKNVEKWEKTLFAEFVPQKGWNSESKTGSFNPDGKRFVAISVGEAGEILHSIKTSIPFQSYHKSDNPVWIKFGAFQKDRKFGREEDKGYRVDKVNNFALGVSGNDLNISVPLSCGEAEVIKVFLRKFIEEALTLEASEQERIFKDNKKDSNSDSGDSNKREGVSEDVEEEDDDDSIPF